MDELPSELSAVTSLKALVASHNQITSPSVTHLSTLKVLNSLILSDNQLTSLPSSLSRLSGLKKFSVSNNKLSSASLPDFSRFTALEELRLNGNADITTIPDTLGHSQTLSLLELSNTGVASWEDVERLRHMTKLVNLGLKGTPLSEGTQYREKAIKTLSRLRILDNVRFDAKFLERKEKAKAKDEQEQEQQEEKGKPVGSAVRASKGDGKTGKLARKGRFPSPPAAEAGPSKHRLRKEKRKEAQEPKPEDDSAAAARRGKKRSLQGDEGAESAGDATGTSEATGKNKKKKKKKTEDTKSDARSERPMKAPKQVGGSLSAPSSTPKQARSGMDDDDDDGGHKESMDKILKARSSVVGVVDVAKQARRAEIGKVRGRGGGRLAPSAQQAQIMANASDPAAPAAAPAEPSASDVLALLAQEKAKASVISGWD